MTDFPAKLAAAFSAVNAAKGRTEVSVGALLQQTQEAEAATTRIRAAAWVRGEGGGALVLSHLRVRAAVDKLVAMTHDTEVVVPLRRMLSLIQLNLNEIIPPQSISYPGGNEVAVRQSATAVVSDSQMHSWHPVCSGQLGISIPLSITVLGAQWDALLAITCDLRTSSLRFNVLELLAAFGPKLRSQTPMPMDLETEVINAAEQALRKILAQPGQALPDIEFGLGRADFFAAGFFSQGAATRVFGSAMRGQRAAFTNLDANGIPNWANIALKLHAVLFTRSFRTEVQNRGLQVFSGPRFPSLNSIDYTVGQRFEASKKIGCIRFSVRVTASAQIRCHVRAVSPRFIVIDCKQIGNVGIDDIDFDPDPLSLLEKLVDDFVEGLVAKLAHIEAFEQKYGLPNATRVDIEVDSASARIFVKQ